LGLVAISIISCSEKSIPIGLRKTIKEIDTNLNDTVKYDFKIAPEEIATSKHHFGLGLGIRNGKNLWKGGFLKMYFRLNGIKHPDDMSAIILTTYHRKLSNNSIQFKKQKQYYKEYWKVAKLGNDTLNKWWDSHHRKENFEIEEENYFSKFEIGQKVLGSINAWEKRKEGENSITGIEVNYIAEIIERNDGILNLKILGIEKPKKGFQLQVMVGDTIKGELDSVFLIPKNK